MGLLEHINSPTDLKRLSLRQLPRVAQEIRQMIMETVQKTGGHLASSLGAVELAVALHYILDTPKDKIVWDVGHQAYAHKILTGRRERLKTLRQWQGLSGFPHREESIYDTFTVGHGSTSISTALGLACAYAEQKKRIKNSLTTSAQKDGAIEEAAGLAPKVVVVIGDASLGGGMALEALNHAGQMQRDLTVIVNDNKMAISKSVGALSHYLNRIISMPIYNRIRKDIENLLVKVPRFGKRMVTTAKRLEESLKNLLVPGILFEELGFRYFGPIDGNNVKAVVRTLKNVLQLEGPVLVHAITVKGKGYPCAEQVPEKFHGVSSGNPEEPRAGKITYTRVFSEKLISLAKQDERIVAITAAMPEGTGLDKFAQVFPNRFYDVGMAEGHAVGFAAGLAHTGLRPVVAIYSTFLQRAYDQIIHDVCLQSLPVIFCLDRAGVVGEDGPTHQGIFDLAYLRHIPNISVMAPTDGAELEAMLEFALTCSRPMALRYPKGAVPQEKGGLNGACPAKIQYGKGEWLRFGKHMVIIALGSMVYPSLAAAEILSAQGIECAVINARFVKPLDEVLLKEICRQFDTVLVAEEGVLEGGFGAAVLEFVERQAISGVNIKCLGLPSAFIPHGERFFLLERYGLCAQGIAQAAADLRAAKGFPVRSKDL